MFPLPPPPPLPTSFLCLLGSEEQNTSADPELWGSSASAEAKEEAQSWLQGLLRCSGAATVNNNFIQYLGVEQLHQLNSDAEPAARMEEFFESGCAKIKVWAESSEDVVVHVVKVEAMLCAVQKEFAREVKAHMPTPTATPPPTHMPRTEGSPSGTAAVLRDRGAQFKKQGLDIHMVRNLLLQTKIVIKYPKKTINTNKLSYIYIEAEDAIATWVAV